MPEKILTFLPEKKKIDPEKKIENVPEKTSICPRKILRKWARKTISAREKNQKKYQKPFSRALFIFSGKKKTLGGSAFWRIVHLIKDPLKIEYRKN